jgi:hypothetical protein
LPPIHPRTGVKIEASARCCKEFSACYTVAVLRLFFYCWYTLPNPSVEHVGNISRSTVVVAMFWLALVKVGTCRSACSIVTVWPTLGADLC